jgi:hypothetical protein
MKKLISRSLVVVFIIVIVGSLLASQCIGGIQHWLYSVGIWGNPVLVDVRIHMKPGWYPLTNVEVTSSDGLKFPSVVFQQIDGCQDRQKVVFQKVSSSFLSRLTNFTLLSRSEYSWGAAEVVKFTSKDARVSQTVAILKKFGLLVKVPSPEVLDEIVSIELR